MSGCSPGGGSSEVCTLAAIPAHSVRQFSVYVPTAALAGGTTVAGDITVTATGVGAAFALLGTVTVASCGAACKQGVATPGVPLPSSPVAPTPANPTKQIVTLPAVQAGATPQPVAVKLESITPSPAVSASDKKLCPIAAGQTHCSGQISSVIGAFAKYNDPVHPIRVSVVARWGTSIPAGRMLMEKDVGGDPLFLLACVKNSTTLRYNVPCVLPETVTGTAAAGNLTTTTTILFTGPDIHFAHRDDSGGTIITPPAAPTAVTATPGAAAGGAEVDRAHGHQWCGCHQLPGHGAHRRDGRANGHVRAARADADHRRTRQRHQLHVQGRRRKRCGGRSPLGGIAGAEGRDAARADRGESDTRRHHGDSPVDPAVPERDLAVK